DLYVYTNDKKLKDNKGLNTFIKFILEDKGKSAEKAGYVALPEKDYKDQLKKLEDSTK
ncbi:MAG: thioredoxine reductase, partial [Staphylococcus simulans]|nr:thioredoxine reductase [Staphylococcus simulans]